MNKNNLKRYLLVSGKVEFIISDTEPEITAAYKNFRATSETDDTAFSTVGGRIDCMQKSFDDLVDIILELDKFLSDLDRCCEIQSNIDSQEDYKNNFH